MQDGRCEEMQAEVFKLVDKAVEERDSERLIAMVKASPQIAKYTNIENMTILFKVTRAGLSKRVIYTLLKYGADPSIQQCTTYSACLECLLQWL